MPKASFSGLPILGAVPIQIALLALTVSRKLRERGPNEGFPECEYGTTRGKQVGKCPVGNNQPGKQRKSESDQYNTAPTTSTKRVAPLHATDRQR